MRTVKVITGINQAPIVEISGYGQTTQVSFADKMFQHGLITWKQRMTAVRIAFTDRYATELLNTKPELFPATF